MKLPYGISNYKTLIEENYIYVDKTQYIEKLESLQKDIMYAYQIKDKKDRKTRLIDISYISIQNQRSILGSSVSDLQDTLYRNHDSKEQTIIEIKNVFSKHFLVVFK